MLFPRVCDLFIEYDANEPFADLPGVYSFRFHSVVKGGKLNDPEGRFDYVLYIGQTDNLRNRLEGNAHEMYRRIDYHGQELDDWLREFIHKKGYYADPDTGKCYSRWCIPLPGANEAELRDAEKALIDLCQPSENTQLRKKQYSKAQRRLYAKQLIMLLVGEPEGWYTRPDAVGRLEALLYWLDVVKPDVPKGGRKMWATLWDCLREILPPRPPTN
jgi:hypothetical protein